MIDNKPALFNHEYNYLCYGILRLLRKAEHFTLKIEASEIMYQYRPGR